MNWHQLKILSLLGILLSGCTQELTECSGPNLDVTRLSQIKTHLFSANGPQADLVLPNPLEASGSLQTFAGDPRLEQLTQPLRLFGLSASDRLESDFLKVRIHKIDDALDDLAKPNSEGLYDFELDDVHYSETMAYYSTSAILNYIESLGFRAVKSRPLYILVRSETEDDPKDPLSVNAFYEHGYLNPSQPRIMRLIGEGEFAPGLDQDMYWHEFGHFMTESASNEVGFDFAGDNGAIYTEGSALHECLSDYLAQSVSGKPVIGRWVARNFSEIPPGEPLRSALDSGRTLQFSEVSNADGVGFNPERYTVAEWCTRVLWDIRSQFVAEDPDLGPLLSDRLVFGALTTMGQDSSIQQFSAALEKMDEQLHCGIHKRAVHTAFEKRGFRLSPPSLDKPLVMSAQAIGLRTVGDSVESGRVSAGGEVTFLIQIQNPNSNVARNVRIRLESLDSKLFPTTYQQGLGDVQSRQVLTIGGDGAGLTIDFSVFGEIDQAAAPGSSIRYRLSTLPENGPPTVFEGVLQL